MDCGLYRCDTRETFVVWGANYASHALYTCFWKLQRLPPENCARKKKLFQINSMIVGSWRPPYLRIKFLNWNFSGKKSLNTKSTNVSFNRERKEDARKADTPINRSMNRSIGNDANHPMSSQLVPGRVISVRGEIYREHGCELMPIFVRNPACLSAPTSFASRDPNQYRLL